MAEHRVSMLRASLRRYEDPVRSADPRIRDLVARLATLEPAPAPRAHFRAELRAQLVAVAPRLIAEGPAIERPRPVTAPATPAAAAVTKSPGARLGSAFGRIGQISIARPVAAFGAVVAIFAVLLGGAVWISQKALPGDTLYSLKRANENVALSLAGGDDAKGRKYLSLAQTRAGEISGLLSRSSATADGAGPSAAGGVNPHTARLITATLDSADSDLRNGSRLLSELAARNGSAGPLSVITGWAPGQIKRMRDITHRLGSGALRERAAASTRLAAHAFSRARALKAALACHCLDKAATDELGPLPCTGCTTVPTPGGQPAPTTAQPSTPGRTRSTATKPHVTGVPGTTAVPSVPVSVAIGPSTVSVPVSVPDTGGRTRSHPIHPTLPTVARVHTVPTLPTLPTDLSTPSDSTSGGASDSQTCTLSVLGTCLP